jgi:hypothetical protein
VKKGKKYLHLTVGVLAGTLSLSGVLSAAPVDCEFSTCSVSSGSTVLTQDDDFNEHHLREFSVNGTNHLHREEFHMDFGSAFPGNDGDQHLNDMFELAGASQDDATDTMVQYWVNANNNLALEITQQIISANADSATILETITYTYSGTESVDFWFVEYTDWDLFDEEEGQVAELTSPTTFTQTFPGRGVSASVTASEAPDYFGIAGGEGQYALMDIGLAHLSGESGPIGPDDVRHGFEYIVTLDTSNTVFTVSFEKTVSLFEVKPIPTMGHAALLLLSTLLGLIGLGRIRARG